MDSRYRVDIIGKDLVASCRRFLRDCEGSDITLCTANGDTRVDEQIKLFIENFGIEANALVLDESPPVLAIWETLCGRRMALCVGSFLEAFRRYAYWHPH